jgi:hypothetical protein
MRRMAPTSVYMTGSDFRAGKLASGGVDRHPDHFGAPARPRLARTNPARCKIYLTPIAEKRRSLSLADAASPRRYSAASDRSEGCEQPIVG